MALIVRILLVILFHGLVILAYDPSPVLDFCIATTDPSIPCKNSSLVTVEDFIFSGLNLVGDFNELGLAVHSVDVTNFPGLKTQGISIARAEFLVGGLIMPHVHPRSTEAILVLEGTISSGFVDTQGRLFSRTISAGDFMVFPMGLMHFVFNVGGTKATVIGVSNSEKRASVMIPTTVFACGMDVEFLARSFGLSVEQISKVRDYLGLPCNVPDLVLNSPDN